MYTYLKRLIAAIVFSSPAIIFAAEVTGSGSTLPAPLLKVWSDSYSLRFPGSSIKYNPSSPAEGVKRLENKEIDFSTIDMPLDPDELKKKGMYQFPFILGAVTPIVNLPNIYAGQFKLDGNTLGEIFLGRIKKWNDPAIVALNPSLHLPDEGIIIIHRFSPPGLRTIIGDFLAKTHPQWKSIKADGDMSGVWPETAIEVKNPQENLEFIKKTPFSIGYGPIQLAIKNDLAYVKLKNKAGNFVSPSDESISEAAANAVWDEKNGFDVVLTDEPGKNSWPMSNASFFLVRNDSLGQARTREVIKYFRQGLRYGGLLASQNNFTHMPASVVFAISTNLKSLGNDN